MTYVYIRSEPSLYTVGFYAPNGRWEAESDHSTSDEAASRVKELNGKVRPRLFDIVAFRGPKTFVRYVVLGDSVEAVAERMLRNVEIPPARLYVKERPGDLLFIDPHFFPMDDPEGMFLWLEHNLWKEAIPFAGKLTWKDSIE